MHSETPQFFASSLRAEDAEKSAELYADLFQGKLIRSSSGHAEVLFSDNQTLVFSKETKECPVSPGTSIWTISEEGAVSFASRLLFSGFQKESESSQYISFLDPWENRLWLYFRK
ncbi:hypothetical protein EHQ53_03080 [Leptospira langatensis]|uniref:VOC family protein n=1 Tax=Leptospira langatensis TaxID=2484983 RepID=A0A5F1ZXW1_9LEPT|nr:hypothetical protein [Leptospira langatensis]TGK04146.1 hypothetical protein EHO57_03310 [Leptospira langatensis]TGL43626.1 hypothetical protein EHQ53_03080 [Leptospira langatensis]